MDNNNNNNNNNTYGRVAYHTIENGNMLHLPVNDQRLPCVYRHIWEAEDVETLDCVRETTNRRDSFSVAVIKDAVVVGHLARKISTVSSLFLKQKGMITCSVNGRRRYSRDLPQGGLEMIRNNYYNIIHDIIVIKQCTNFRELHGYNEIRKN